MNAKMSVFVICVEATIYFYFYNLHDCTFKLQRLEMEENIVHKVTAIVIITWLKQNNVFYHTSVSVSFNWNCLQLYPKILSYVFQYEKTKMLDKMYNKPNFELEKNDLTFFHYFHRSLGILTDDINFHTVMEIYLCDKVPLVIIFCQIILFTFFNLADISLYPTWRFFEVNLFVKILIA